MPLELFIAESARRDLVEIWVYIAERDFDAAEDTVAGVQKTSRLLCHQPNMGADRPELGEGILSFPVGKYVVFYAFDDQALTVRRVLHGKRDIQGQF